MQKDMARLATLDTALDEMADCKNAMACKECDGEGCTACEGNRPSKSLEPIEKRPRGQGMGAGAAPEESKTRTNFLRLAGQAERRQRGFGRRRPGRRRRTARGRSKKKSRATSRTPSSKTAEALSDQRLPHDYRDHAKKYFDTLREGTALGQRDATPSDDRQPVADITIGAIPRRMPTLGLETQEVADPRAELRYTGGIGRALNPCRPGHSTADLLTMMLLEVILTVTIAATAADAAGAARCGHGRRVKSAATDRGTSKTTPASPSTVTNSTTSKNTASKGPASKGTPSKATTSKKTAAATPASTVEPKTKSVEKNYPDGTVRMRTEVVSDALGNLVEGTAHRPSFTPMASRRWSCTSSTVTRRTLGFLGPPWAENRRGAIS